MNDLYSISYSGRKAAKRKKWETKEIEAVERHMMRFIHSLRVPGKMECEKCLLAEPLALKDRDWMAIKFHIHNRIIALKRKI